MNRVNRAFRALPIASLVAISALLAIITVGTVQTKNTWAFSGSGSGSSGDPFVITSCAELQEMQTDLDASYILGGNVDCQGFTYIPVGFHPNPFEGTLDGKGYSIENLNLSGLSSQAGIFARTSGATVRDLYLEDFTFNTVADSGGLLAGVTVSSTFTQIHGRSSTINNTQGIIGGLVGSLGGSTLNKSSAEGLTIVSGGSQVGGLVGEMVGPSSLSESYFQGSVAGDTKVGGIVGEIGAGPTVLGDTYSEANITASLNSGDIIGYGTPYQDGGGNYASSSLTEGEDVDGWDFATVWYVRSGNYPGLRPVSLPTLLCEAATATETTMSGSCSASRLLEGDTVWELQYRATSQDEWQDLASQNGPQFDVTVTDLLEGTDYELRFRYVDNIGTGEWGKLEITTLGDSDLDNDGATNIEEYLAPNNGDANADLSPDYLQANVLSYYNSFISNYAVLEAVNCTSISAFQIGLESSEMADPDYNYPMGLASFHILCPHDGDTATIRQYYYGIEGNDTYSVRKWMPDGSYREIPNYELLGMPVEGNGIVFFIEYQITDGGELDDDGVANGIIVDPSGAALKYSAPVDGANGSGLAATGSSQLVTTYLAATLLLAASLVYSRSLLTSKLNKASIKIKGD